MLSNYDLGLKYYSGLGTEKSPEKALYYFEKALNQDREHEAAYFLGKIYMEYYSSKVDLAIKYLEHASIFGFHKANYCLFEIYKDNTYGRPQLKLCIEYLNKCLNHKFSNEYFGYLITNLNKLVNITLKNPNEKNFKLVMDWLKSMISSSNKDEVKELFESMYYKIAGNLIDFVENDELARIIYSLQANESKSIENLKKYLIGVSEIKNEKKRIQIESYIEETLTDIVTLELRAKNYKRAYDISETIKGSTNISKFKKEEARKHYLQSYEIEHSSNDNEIDTIETNYISKAEKLFNLLKVGYNFDGFYHQLNILNLCSVLESGCLYSRHKLGNKFYNNANEEIIDNTDESIKKCVRFYFAPKTPTNYKFEEILPNKMVYLKFNWKLMTVDEKAMFYNGNAASKYSTGILVRQFLKVKNFESNIMNWPEIFGRGSYNVIGYPEILDDYSIEHNKWNITRQRNAEFLVNNQVKIYDYLEFIIFKNEASLQEFKKLLNDEQKFNKYKKYIKVDEKYFRNDEVIL